MKLSYRLRQTRGSAPCWVAECLEAEAIGEGTTEHEAIASLEAALRERLLRPDAVAPPSRPTPAPEIELVRVS